MLFDAHNHCLAALGGIPERGIYDNMKTAVDQVGRGKQRTVNARFRAMVSHFLFEADFQKGVGVIFLSKTVCNMLSSDEK